jgi:hypothetical protein
MLLFLPKVAKWNERLSQNGEIYALIIIITILFIKIAIFPRKVAKIAFKNHNIDPPVRAN